MAAEVDRHLVRAGSLSSDSESSSSSDSEGESRRRLRSAVVQVPSNHRRFHAPPESPHDAPSSRSPTDHRSSPSASKSPHQLDLRQHRSPSLSPSPPLVSRKRDRRHSQSPSPPNNHRRRRSRSKSPFRQRRRRMLSNSPPMNRKRQRIPPGSPAQRRRRSSSLPPDRRGHGRPFHQSPPRSEGEEGEWVEGGEAPPPKRKKEEIDPILTRTGGAYIPPARLRMMQQSITDKSSVAYQRLSWEALKKSINGLVNKVNVSNIANIIQELFQENVVRGRGLLAQSVIRAQGSSPTFTHVYAGLVAIVNTKFPQTGELIARRLLVRFRKGFRRNDKDMCNTAVKFVAHLVNQQVLHELVALELLTLLLEDPTDDSVEVAIGFLKECGLKLTEVSPRGVHAVFETLRSILHSGKITSRVQYMVEVMFAIRKDKFKEHPTVIDGLDLVQEEDQITHLLSLSDDFDTEDILNVFHPDPDFVANEEKYKAIKSEILGEDEEGSSSGESGEGSSEEESEEEEEEEEGAKGIDMTDMTDAKVLAIRRQIYLTIMSSLDYEECAHKLLKSMEEGQEHEIAHMLVEVCSQERSYLRFYGLLGQRFCQLNQIWVEMFDGVFQEQYSTVHRLETNKLRNVAKFFAQLFYGDALPWTCMSCIHLNEEETNSSSRIFVKILFQELAEFMGMSKLNERLRDPLLSLAFEGLLPRDNPKNTRFAINFFTSIGLGGLTDDLREHLKNAQKLIMAQHQEVSSSDTNSDSSDSSSEDSSDSSTEDESSSSSSSSSEEEQPPRHHRKQREEPKHHARRRSRDKEEVREKQHSSKKREEDKREDRRRRVREEEMEVEREEERSGRSKGDERGKERERDRRDRRAERDDKRRDKHGRERRRDRDGEDEDEQERERKRGRKVEGRDRDKDESGRERRGRDEDESGRERRRGRDEDESGRERRRGRDEDESGRERRRGRDEDESGRERRRGRDEEESGRERRRGRDERESDSEDVRRRNEGRDHGRYRSERGARRERDEDTREQQRERRDRRHHNHRERED